MIDPKRLSDSLSAVNIDFFAGVPDSLLKEFCAYISDNSERWRHIITANEGNALAVAAGYHMSTGRTGLVYLQNSGLGNVINPLTSIADTEVYQIPVVLLIGWRGAPGVKDEPQHIKQGRITPAQLKLLEIPYRIVDADSDPGELAGWSRRMLDDTGAPVALLVRENTFGTYRSEAITQGMSAMRREEALDCLLDLAGPWPIVSTTGKTSREVFSLRVLRNEKQRDFLTVGGMGHTASIALGVAIGQPRKRVVCIDGDGSALMHLGALPIIGALKPPNLIHVLLNNAAHDSVGGQPTVGDHVDFVGIAYASGYTASSTASTREELVDVWKRLEKLPGPVLLEVRIATGSRDDLGRPSSSPLVNKDAFMEWLGR